MNGEPTNTWNRTSAWFYGLFIIIAAINEIAGGCAYAAIEATGRQAGVHSSDRLLDAVTPVPEVVRSRFGLSPFYQKYMEMA
jgi:hypothetical protein